MSGSPIRSLGVLKFLGGNTKLLFIMKCGIPVAKKRISKSSAYILLVLTKIIFLSSIL